jgi:hypothetical protein
MHLNKKGGLQISINAIVVLILAITVLGIGLAFINGMFSDTFKRLDEVSGSIEKQMREKMEQEPGRLVLYNDNLDITRKEKQKETYFGIRNELGDGEREFEVDFYCTSAFKDDLDIPPDESISFEHLNDVTVGEDEIRILPVIIKLDPNAALTTYECVVEVDGGDYAKEYMFISIT